MWYCLSLGCCCGIVWGCGVLLSGFSGVFCVVWCWLIVLCGLVVVLLGGLISVLCVFVKDW